MGLDAGAVAGVDVATGGVAFDPPEAAAFPEDPGGIDESGNMDNNLDMSGRFIAVFVRGIS